MHIRTFSGRLVDPLRPVPDDVEPYSMMHSLCLLNRFTGHSKWPYSVGQHTLILVRYLEKRTRDRGIIRAAIIHDFSEAWFNDLASPVKVELPEYKEYNRRASELIRGVLGVSSADLYAMDYADKRVYIDERDALANFQTGHDFGMNDNLVRLGIDPKEFQESYWRDVRNKLWAKFDEYFPEWEGLN